MQCELLKFVHLTKHAEIEWRPIWCCQAQLLQVLGNGRQERQAEFDVGMKCVDEIQLTKILATGQKILIQVLKLVVVEVEIFQELKP